MGTIVRTEQLSGQRSGQQAVRVSDEVSGEFSGEEEQSQYLTFLLGGEMFAMPILNVKEIIEYGSLTTVPMMPEFVRGVINLRGSVVPVVDIALRIGRKAGAVTKRTCIVIVEAECVGESGDEPQDVGVVVDSVSAVLEIPRADIEQAPSFGAKIRMDFIRGIGKVAGKFVVILNADRVLSINEMALLGGEGGAEPEVGLIGKLSDSSFV